jgi:hypothetical protein
MFDLMLVFAQIGALTALLGAVMGLGIWRLLSPAQRFFVGFCGASGICGVAQAVCPYLGLSQALFGNLWDFTLLVLAVPGLWQNLRRGRRRFARGAWAIGLAGWLTIRVVDGNLKAFEFQISAAVYAFVACVALLLITQYAEDSHTVWSKPGFVRGTAILAACSVDIFATLALAHYDVVGRSFTVHAMTFVNLLWILAYAAITASFFLVERPPRSESHPAYPHEGPGFLVRSTP